MIGPLHSPCLASTGLAIGKYSSVISGYDSYKFLKKYTFDNRDSDLLIDLELYTSRSEYFIKWEIVFILITSYLWSNKKMYINFDVFIIILYTFLSIICHLDFIEWTQTAYYTNWVCHLFILLWSSIDLGVVK